MAITKLRAAILIINVERMLNINIIYFHSPSRSYILGCVHRPSTPHLAIVEVPLNCSAISLIFTRGINKEIKECAGEVINRSIINHFVDICKPLNVYNSRQRINLTITKGIGFPGFQLFAAHNSPWPWDLCPIPHSA